jgi:PASTA domain
MESRIGSIITGVFIAVVGGYLVYFLTTPQRILVPDVVNKSVVDAERILWTAGLVYQREYVPGPAKDIVIHQLPSAGKWVAPKTAVRLEIQIGVLSDRPMEPGTPSSSNFKRIILLAGTPIQVRLPQGIHVNGQMPPASYEG